MDTRGRTRGAPRGFHRDRAEPAELPGKVIDRGAKLPGVGHVRHRGALQLRARHPVDAPHQPAVSQQKLAESCAETGRGTGYGVAFFTAVLGDAPRYQDGAFVWSDLGRRPAPVAVTAPALAACVARPAGPSPADDPWAGCDRVAASLPAADDPPVTAAPAPGAGVPPDGPAGTTTGAGARPRFRLGNRPPLTGFRAFALSTVLVYHSNFKTWPGAWIAIQMFFVLSGFLITAMLAAEGDRNGRVSLRSFYARRAARLLPPLLLTIGLILVYAEFVHVAEASTRVWGDSFAALFYYADYRQAFGHEPFFGYLAQTWSLSI